MNGVTKGMLIVLVALYIVSPVDLCPGPVDDLIVLLVTLVMRKGTNKYLGELRKEMSKCLSGS